jgi:hypothetical protein
MSANMKKWARQGEFQKTQTTTDLDAESISAMFARPVLALISEPIIRCGVDSLALVSSEQLVDIRDPHRTPDDLAYTRHEQVATLSEDRLRCGACAAAARRMFLHVKRLEFSGETMKEDRRADDIGHLALRRLRYVVSDGVRDHLGLPIRVCDHVAVRVLGFVRYAMIVQPCDGIDISHAHEGARRWCKGGVELLDECRGGLVLQELVHSFTNLVTRSVPAYDKVHQHAPQSSRYGP